MKDIEFSPGQVALLLGVPRTDVIDWLMSGELVFKKVNKTIFIKKRAIVDFLCQHRELVGRLYCDDGLSVLTEWRQEIIEEMDNRWPLGPDKQQNF